MGVDEGKAGITIWKSWWYILFAERLPVALIWPFFGEDMDSIVFELNFEAALDGLPD